MVDLENRYFLPALHLLFQIRGANSDAMPSIGGDRE